MKKRIEQLDRKIYELCYEVSQLKEKLGEKKQGSDLFNATSVVGFIIAVISAAYELKKADPF